MCVYVIGMPKLPVTYDMIRWKPNSIETLQEGLQRQRQRGRQLTRYRRRRRREGGVWGERCGRGIGRGRSLRITHYLTFNN